VQSESSAAILIFIRLNARCGRKVSPYSRNFALAVGASAKNGDGRQLSANCLFDTVVELRCSNVAAERSAREFRSEQVIDLTYDR
jgi:hypothetical protein